MLQVTYSFSEPGEDPAAFTMRATAVATGTLSPKVFIYRESGGPFDYTTGSVGDGFSAVASLAQMESIPEDAPAPEYPFYRVSVAEFVFKSAAEMADVREILDQDLRQLVDDYIRSLDLPVSEIVNYP